MLWRKLCVTCAGAVNGIALKPHVIARLCARYGIAAPRNALAAALLRASDPDAA